MQVQEEHEHVVCNDDHHMQIIIKGKRTKRQRLPSPLRLAMSTTSRSSTSDINSGGSSYDVATTSTTASIEFRNRTEEEDHDMANCLILLAQGYHNNQHVAAPDHNNNNNNKKITGLYPYQCKTCNRCFPSFQALGGHRTSHKKPNKATNSTTEEKQGKVATFVNELANDHHNYDPTSTNLTLQLSSRDLYSSSSNVTTTTTKSKVHECSICGAEFTSGQALGGHMRRHRTSTTLSMSGADNIVGGGSPGTQEAKKPRNVLKLDLNLPAPEDDHREPKFPFQSKEKVIVFSATSLVDCHY